MKMRKLISVLAAALMLCSLLPVSVMSVSATEAYLGCETTGSEQWNITTDYVYAAFTPGASMIDAVKAYLRVRAGESTITAAICTDVYGQGEVLAEASQSFNPGGSTNVWAEFVFDAPVNVNPGQTYYLRIGSVGSPKITMYGYATTGTDDYRAYVDNGRSGSGWRTNYLPNFVVSEVESKLYLGCTELGAENWNIQGDYIWAPFATAADHINAIKAYVRVQPGVGTLTAAIYTDYYGKGELVAAATLNCNYESATKGWQTLTFDQPVAVNPGQVYYVRFGSDDVKVTLWGKDSATAQDPWQEHVDAGRAGTGWSNNRLVNFEVVEMKTYLGCTELGAENWNIQNDYLWAPFSPATHYVDGVKAYVRVQPGVGTLTAALCTDYYGKGEVLGTAVLNCNYESATKGWQTLTFDQPVAVNPGQVYYVRFGSDDVKVTLWGKDSATAQDPWQEHVDAGRAGTGWSNNRLVNFEVVEMKTYLGCTELGAENWNIQNDYLWAPFSPATHYVDGVKAYVRVQPGVGTLTAALCTDYYGKGEVLGTAVLNCNYESATKGWQTLTFDLPVAVNPGQVYYIRLGSDDVKVTLWGKDSATANDPWREFVDVGRAGTGWSNNRLVNMEIVETTLSDIISCEGMSISEDVNGLAFKFNMDAANVAVKNGHLIILDNATAAPFANAKGYALTHVGAIASNDPSAELTVDNLSARTKDIAIKNVFELYENSMDFTVRIINIPDANKDTVISVRPYYILSNGEQSVIIYDDVVTGTYNACA